MSATNWVELMVVKLDQMMDSNTGCSDGKVIGFLIG